MPLPRDDRAVVDVVGGEGGRSFEVRGVEEAVRDELFGRDEERVAGEGREAAIGGVPVPRRPDRHRLPERQARRRHPVEQRVGGRAEIADAEARRQGGGMQKETRRPRRHARMVDEERRAAV